MANPCKRRFQRVIIPLGNGIEFVVVTAGAVHCQTEERLSHHGDHVFDFLLPDAGFHESCPTWLLPASSQGAQTRKPVATMPSVVCGSSASPANCSLMNSSRAYPVEALDHIVPVSPGMVPEFVIFKSMAFAKPYQVQPMPSPTLPITRRGQVAVHYFLKSFGRSVLHERCDFGRRGWQAEQVKAGSAKQAGFVSGARGESPSLSSLASTKASTEFRTQPVFLTVAQEVVADGSKAHRRAFVWFWRRPNHPARWRPDRSRLVKIPISSLVKRLAFLRHLFVGNQTGHQMNQRAVGAFSRDNVRAQNRLRL